MLPLDQILQYKLDNIKAAQAYREIKSLKRMPNHKVICDGQKLISFCDNDYLGFAFNNDIKEIADKYSHQLSLGASSSRLIYGSHPLYEQLERKLASYLNYQQTLIFGSGYLANIGVIPAIMGRHDLIIADKLIHASMIDGAVLSQAKIVRFNHNNAEHCHRLLDKYRSKHRYCLILTENIFSMDGDLSPINSLKKLATDYNCWLYSDGAHNLLKAHQTDIYVTTLSKAFASYGGVVAASGVMIDYLKNSARSLIYSTALPPSSLITALSALEYLTENPELAFVPLKKAQLFTSKLAIRKADSQIVSIIIGDNAKTIELTSKLKELGFLVACIRPPTVPANTARIRISFSVDHHDQDIERLASSIKPYLK